MSHDIPQADATTLVIFGATGDLTHRKLIPALYRNRKKGRLWDRTRIVGVARRDWTTDFFREHVLDGVKKFGGTFDEKIWADFASRLHYVRGDLEVAADYAQPAWQHGGSIGVDMPEQLAVQGHQVLLEMVLRNLVENAIRHTPHGTQIDVQAGLEAGQCWLQVCDDGARAGHAPAPGGPLSPAARHPGLHVQ